jgi:hypothetical protein
MWLRINTAMAQGNRDSIKLEFQNRPRCAASWLVRAAALGIVIGLLAGTAAAQGAYPTRYFRVASGNNLLIALGPLQWTDHNAGEIGRDNSVSRNPGDFTSNSYANWTMGTPLTPGLPNQVPSVVMDWAIY